MSTDPPRIKGPQLWVCRLGDIQWPKIKRPPARTAEPAPKSTRPGKETCARAEWEPIATAPRTGQTILLYGPHVEPYTGYYDWVQESFCDRAFGDRCEPEYWQPLPAHPTDKTIRGKLK